ncbi:MAG TPA: SDR family NAD-dependent epimerase/dehydratase, partial [Beijerinckiaceae bacterium]|nr:SDR family NAD-dependent epimerase/dehydratase [Beijerinckiaceae bacterium]
AYEGEASGPVNLGNPVELTVNELVARVVAMTGSPSRLVKRPLPIDDPRRRRPDISLARELLAWTPKVPLEEGLKATIAWFARDGAKAPAPVKINGRAKGANGGAPAVVSVS